MLKCSLKQLLSVRILQRNTTNDIYLASLKSVGQANRLETQAEFLYYSLEAEFLLLWETLDLGIAVESSVYTKVIKELGCGCGELQNDQIPPKKTLRKEFSQYLTRLQLPMWLLYRTKGKVHFTLH